MLVQIAGTHALSDSRSDCHVFETVHGQFALVIEGSRIYSVDAQTAELLKSENSRELLKRLQLTDGNRDMLPAPRKMPVRSLSLAVAQKCNLGCSYCYAQQGDFGAKPQSMEKEIALAAVALLLKDASKGESVNLAFLGGEPLLNRSLVRESAQFALELAIPLGVRVNFSITTNGTLLTADDGEFFERHGFAVTVSLDGVGETHDNLRPFRGGKDSYARIIENVLPLLAAQRRMQVSARVTVTPRNLQLKETLDELLSLGFHSVGFSPMLHAPSGNDEMSRDDLREMLRQMVDCGEEFERHTARGKRYAFSNMATAVREIHKGTHRPYPCGAGGGYFGVSASGGLYACHRFVEDEKAFFGDVWQGVDPAAQSQWLQQRHVDSQSPCSACWARYLCGGGCHHEVIHRGRPACDYIRGWLDYCLKAYVRLLAAAPEYFA
jgi:uncharacterized protein